MKDDDDEKHWERVALNGRTEAKLTKAAEQLGNPDRIADVGDITEPATADKIVNAAVERFARLDVLVNNAGIFSTKPFTDYTVEELDGYLGYLTNASWVTGVILPVDGGVAAGGDGTDRRRQTNLPMS